MVVTSCWGEEKKWSFCSVGIDRDLVLQNANILNMCYTINCK